MRLKIALLLLSLLTSGCSLYSPVSPERRAMGDLYSVQSRIAWSRADEAGIEIWTVDGPLLEALRFVTLRDGDPLIPAAGSEEKVPRFRAHMRPNEVVEFFVASLKSISGGIDTYQLSKGIMDARGFRAASINASSIETKNVRPADFGRLTGFRFDFDFLSKEGLEREGIALGAVHDGKLLLLVYTGTKEYYFQKYRDEIEHLFSSVEMIQ